jgi:hypothetical protein
LFRVSIQQISDLWGADFKGMSLFGLQVCRFDGGAVSQVDHAMGWRPLVLAVKKFGSFQQEIATTPVLEGQNRKISKERTIVYTRGWDLLANQISAK